MILCMDVKLYWSDGGLSRLIVLSDSVMPSLQAKLSNIQKDSQVRILIDNRPYFCDFDDMTRLLDGLKRQEKKALL